MVKSSDVLSIHANFTDEETDLFNASVFRKMKPDSILSIRQEADFITRKIFTMRLLKKKSGGAGLDVTNPEPVEDHDPILELSNVCILPHIGSATVEARNGMAKLAAENLIAFSKGEKMPHCANPEFMINNKTLESFLSYKK